MHSGVKDMDYIIGGLTTVLLFAYLIYALLKPEKF
jgi:K+-transporting ATPase KdpF subunit